jgi:hypothetical protein
LRTRCSSTLFLVGFLSCFSWFLGTLQCCVLSHDTDNRSAGLLGCDSCSRGSSSSSPSSRCEPSSCTRSVVLVRLRIFHIVDISWILGLHSPGHFSVALLGFISFIHSFVMIIIGQDILF